MKTSVYIIALHTYYVYALLKQLSPFPLAMTVVRFVFPFMLVDSDILSMKLKAVYLAAQQYVSPCKFICSFPK